jgi:iron complex transport system substrate-binding protein
MKLRKNTLTAFVLVFLSSWSCQVDAKQITDMAGRTVTIPDEINRVYGTSPISTYMTYSMNPELVAGLNSPPAKAGKAYLRPEYLALPVIGGWFGQGKISNLEVLLAIKPDIILICAWKHSAINNKIETALKPFNIPIVYTYIETLDEYPKAYRFLGKVLNLEQRGELLARHAQQIIDRANKTKTGLNPAAKPRIYYAEGAKGLQTECDGSIHAQIIPLSGGVNVHKCEDNSTKGMMTVSMEQILQYQPDVIITHDDEFFSTIRTDPKWQTLTAVKTGRIYKIPTQPFNWFDRPPSFMRLLGLEWLQSVLFQQPDTRALVTDIQSFYRDFLAVNLSGSDVQELLKP